MRICDLPSPVTASKTDWLPGTSWIGFTPQAQGSGAAARCQSTIVRQMSGGYVLERVTDSFGNPNPAHAADPDLARDREKHSKLKDRLIAVHRLRATARPLNQIIGEDEFNKLQDVWATEERTRWSVAFPIVETYKIIGQPTAKSVFPSALFRSLYASRSATLRLLSDEARAAIADLEIIRNESSNAWIAIEDEFAIASRSEVSPLSQASINDDLDGVLEGVPEERARAVRKRAGWLADKFVSARRKRGPLICDECSFNPLDLVDGNKLPTRSFFDVHHNDPMAEGVRYTTIADLSLLCPTCHRIKHVRLRG